jgi:hypothetical protein
MIKIYELDQGDSGRNNVALGRTIFMNYFLDLYSDKTSEALQIKTDTEKYLNTIFDNTEQALKANDNLCALFAYCPHADHAIGFCTFGTLEDPKIILVRTLPIDVNYKSIELDIRNAFIDHVVARHAGIKQIVIMVRKANAHHQDLCMKAGFIQRDAIFDTSGYIKNSYDRECYYGYTKNI